MNFITVADALALDEQWQAAGYPSTAPRIYELGGRRMVLLGVPGDDDAPLYRYRDHDMEGRYAPAFYHVSGPHIDL